MGVKYRPVGQGAVRVDGVRQLFFVVSFQVALCSSTVDVRNSREQWDNG